MKITFTFESPVTSKEQFEAILASYKTSIAALGTCNPENKKLSSLIKKATEYIGSKNTLGLSRFSFVWENVNANYGLVLTDVITLIDLVNELFCKHPISDYLLEG